MLRQNLGFPWLLWDNPSIKISVCWTPAILLYALLDFKQLGCCIVHLRQLKPQIKNKYSSVCIRCKFRHFRAVDLVTVCVCQSAPYKSWIRIYCTQIWALVRTLVYLTLGHWWFYFSAIVTFLTLSPFTILDLLATFGFGWKINLTVLQVIFFRQQGEKTQTNKKHWRPLTKRLG